MLRKLRLRQKNGFLIKKQRVYIFLQFWAELDVGSYRIYYGNTDLKALFGFAFNKNRYHILSVFKHDYPVSLNNKLKANSHFWVVT